MSKQAAKKAVKKVEKVVIETPKVMEETPMNETAMETTIESAIDSATELPVLWLDLHISGQGFKKSLKDERNRLENEAGCEKRAMTVAMKTLPSKQANDLNNIMQRMRLLESRYCVKIAGTSAIPLQLYPRFEAEWNTLCNEGEATKNALLDLSRSGELKELLKIQQGTYFNENDVMSTNEIDESIKWTLTMIPNTSASQALKSLQTPWKDHLVEVIEETTRNKAKAMSEEPVKHIVKGIGNILAKVKDVISGLRQEKKHVKIKTCFAGIAETVETLFAFIPPTSSQSEDLQNLLNELKNFQTTNITKVKTDSKAQDEVMSKAETLANRLNDIYIME
jgi:hypothetical protein